MRSLSLLLARGWYLVLGLAGVLATAGGIFGALSGSIFEWYVAGAGIGIGLLSIGAALWVHAADRGRALVAWLGIVALGVVFLWPLTWGLGSLHDTIVYAVLPTALGLLAASRMAWARAHAPMSSSAGTAAGQAPADPA